ncbi:hypothetical protein C1Y63_09190 [Corynebacterium sp. 13CS0277]|uniref:hypothetical protein n=1 Tax=Corynebacterium sp. 13CS0277 TaxID=2071994 RepID=UPI000D03358E|nr:hypothetical protein [Corynebacterium sp. 13CS0277]PRQ10903.1 hypothetical protein C1Y63_09190 [Corynebacterium sp. 13CS0277]
MAHDSTTPTGSGIQPVTVTSWGPRHHEGEAYTLELFYGQADENTGTIIDRTVVGRFTEADKGHTVTATVAGEPWEVTRDETAVTATLPSGRIFTLTGEKGRISGSKRLTADLAGRQVDLVNESKQDWVLEDVANAEAKLGQFSGGNRGVRTSLVEWEDDAAVDDAERFFLAYAARVALESRLWLNTWILTASLLVLAPLIVLIYLYGPVFG